MAIHEIHAAEVQDWCRAAAEHMLELRTASGALSLADAGGFLHRIIRQFKVGTPVNSRIFINDDASNWLWLSTEPELKLVDVKIDRMTEEWIDAFDIVAQGRPVAYESFLDEDPLVNIVPHRDYSLDMAVELQRVRWDSFDRGDVILRPMSSSELMPFMVAVANDRGRSLAEVTPGETANSLKRNAFRELEDTLLVDGISTPGQLLYSVTIAGEVVGGAWLDIDSGTAHIQSVIIYPEHSDNGIRQAAVAALARVANSEGMRRIACTVIPPSDELRAILDDMGFLPVRQVHYSLENAPTTMLNAGNYGSNLVPSAN